MSAVHSHHATPMDGGFLERAPDLLARSSELSNRLVRELRGFDESLLDDFPVETYIGYLEHYPRKVHYAYTGAEVEAYCARILQRSNQEMLATYHKLLLVRLIGSNIKKVQEGRFPEEIRILFARNFERIQNDIVQKSYGQEFYLYPKDKFIKDLGVCTLRLIPAGAEKINVMALPRRWLVQNGVSQFVKGAMYVLRELKGIRPTVYYYHMDSNDPDLLAEFNPEGWTRFYKRVASLLAMNKDIKAIVSIPWFLDPQLATVSPRLKYLGDFFTQNGGRLFYAGRNETAIRGALAKSATRRKLYEEGKYLPTIYMGIWPRKRIIEWATRNGESLPP